MSDPSILHLNIEVVPQGQKGNFRQDCRCGTRRVSSGHLLQQMLFQNKQKEPKTNKKPPFNLKVGEHHTLRNTKHFLVSPLA